LGPNAKRVAWIPVVPAHAADGGNPEEHAGGLECDPGDEDQAGNADRRQRDGPELHVGQQVPETELDPEAAQASTGLWCQTDGTHWIVS
jgi:hypothetical protein